MDTIRDIGDALVTTRRAKGMSQRELASRLGTTQQQVARWEAGRYRTARFGSVAAAAAALGVGVQGVSPDRPVYLAAETPAVYLADSAGDLASVITRIRANRGELAERFGVRRLGVYGSFAAGTQRSDSDVDLVVELEQVTFAAEFGAAARLQEILGRRVDLALPGELRPEVRERALTEAVYALGA